MTERLPSIRYIIMEMLKKEFSNYDIWPDTECELAILCAELPEANTDHTKREMVKGLKAIRELLLERGVLKENVKFLDEELVRYVETKQISLYLEEDDVLPHDIVDKYSRLSLGAEGVMGIHLPYNYLQCARLTNGVYNRTGLIKFYISREVVLSGKIIAEIYEYAQKVPIATLIESRKINQDTEEPMYKRIALFGEKIETRSVNKLKEIEIPFYVYRFITETNREYILFSTTKSEIGDYIVTGMVTQCDDYRMLTDSAKLPTKLPYIFAQQIRNRIIKYKNHNEFHEALKLLNYTPEDMFNYPYTLYSKKKKKNLLLNQPEWFKWLMWSWLTHTPIGLFAFYPLHIMVVGPPQSGKSVLLDSFYAHSKESRKIFSGAGSTLKNLIPSFKYNPAKLGFLAEANRFAYCDEFLRCILRNKSGSKDSDREEDVAMMNDLLEHQKREAGSGISRVHVNMTARVLATTNPVRGIHNMTDLANRFDESFLSRILVYYQPQDHVDMIRQSNDSELDKYTYVLSSNEWVSILDYLHSFSAEYDMEKVLKVYDSVIPILSEVLATHYASRHKHHIECIIDGIIKARCLIEKDMTFTAKPIDYERLKMVWQSIIRSWIDSSSIKQLPVFDRIYYMPALSQWLYWRIVECKRPISRHELKDIAMAEMPRSKYLEALVILVDNGLLIEGKDSIRPHTIKGDTNKVKGLIP